MSPAVVRAAESSDVGTTLSNLSESQFGRQSGARWWTHKPSGERWLELVTENSRGGTDNADAVHEMGAGSWTHGNRAYLDERDAAAWMERTGYGELDVANIRSMRRPSGSVLRGRDAQIAADMVSGKARGNVDNEYFGRMEVEHYDPDEETPDMDDLPDPDPRVPF